MKGIFPASCRLLGYVLLLLSVFVPLLMYMFGQVNDGNLLYVKLGMRLVIWISLFMVFLAKMKDENEEAFAIRRKAMVISLYLWGVYYVGVLLNAAYGGNLQEADNSVGIVYMVICVFCKEFLMQKAKIEKNFRQK